jgi:hypothetical protein
VLVLAVAISLPVLASSSDKPGAAKKPENAAQIKPAQITSAHIIVDKAIEKKWGVRPISMQLTAADYMLDFRYKIVDAEKATAIINRNVKPYLIIEKTGVKLNVPQSSKIGSLRQTRQFEKTNRNYFMIFVNPGRIVKSGDKVTLVAGDFKLEHVTVN